jgi:hypothetical protein
MTDHLIKAPRTANASSAPHAKLPDFLMADYWKKVDYLSNHFTRVWTRFNFFLTLQAGLSTALWAWFQKDGIFANAALGVTLIGLVSSGIWYVFGAQDRYLVGVYRDQVQAAAAAAKQEFSLPKDYIFVGDPDRPAQQKHIFQWRSAKFSTTRLAAWFPLIVAAYWLVMIVLVNVN